jgi:hypothetical protein
MVEAKIELVKMAIVDKLLGIVKEDKYPADPSPVTVEVILSIEIPPEPEPGPKAVEKEDK